MATLTEGDDVFVRPLAGDVMIDALGGNDVVLINQYVHDEYGAVTLNGGSGDDELTVYTAGYVSLSGEDGNDTLKFEHENGEAHGGAGDDTIEASSSESIFIYGDDGNDTLSQAGERGGAAYGGNGDDYISLSMRGIGGNGSDFVNGSRAEGNDGDDITLAGILAEGGEGSDYVGGSLFAHGGGGNDIVKVRSEAEGGAGRDVFFPLLIIRVFAETDYLSDTPIVDFEGGVDVMAVPLPMHVVVAFTGRANEVVSDGTNTSFDLDGDGVADLLLPATGLLTQDDFVTVFLDTTSRSGFPAFDDNIDQVAAGTAANEFAYGSGGDDTLTGYSGKDVLHGGFGDDSLSGNSGDDLLVGNAGDDRVYGGSGDDELDGGDGHDTLSASTGDDFAYGGDGNDLIAGGDGADRLLGERGDDRLNGGGGNDTLAGGDGRDTLIGSAGKDTLTGGAGPDQFLFMPGHSRPGGSLRDVVTDFTSGEDVLDLRALGITDMAAQVSMQAVGSGLILHVDLDSDGFDYADFAVRLAGVSSLAASDLLI